MINDKKPNPSDNLPVITRERIAEELGRPTNWVDDRILANLPTGDLGDGCVITPTKQFHDYLLGLCFPTSDSVPMEDDWIENKEVQQMLIAGGAKAASRSSIDRLAKQGLIVKDGRKFSKLSVLKYLKEQDGV